MACEAGSADFYVELPACCEAPPQPHNLHNLHSLACAHNLAHNLGDGAGWGKRQWQVPRLLQGVCMASALACVSCYALSTTLQQHGTVR
eukprot:g1248.t1